MRLLKFLLPLVAVGPLLAANAQMDQFAEEFVQGALALSPSSATAQGYHEYAGRHLDQELDDFSLAGVRASKEFYARALKRVDLLEKGATPEGRADLELIRAQCELTALEFDRIQNYRHNPTMYVEMIGNAIYTPFVIEYAPEHERMQHIIARLKKIPGVIQVAEKNLVSAPEIWNRVAQQENQGDIDLIDHAVRAKVPADLKPQFDTAADGALRALRAFNDFLKESLSKKTADWRLGGELYHAKFKPALLTDRTPEQVLAGAEKMLVTLREQMRGEAAAIYPKLFPGQTPPGDLNALVGAVLEKIARQHTTPEQYIETAKHDLANTTEFVREHHLIALPSGDNLNVIPTPEFMRGIYGVGGFAPAPALQPKLGAYYWITPFTPDMSKERVESKLREYDKWGLEILTIHEAMPGHYVQAEYATQVQPHWRGVLRELFGSVPYVEGWAVYATEVMINQGFDDTPEMKLTFGKQLLRVVANTILDVKLQTGQMTDQEALDLMIKQTFQEREEAEKKLQRAKLASCQLPAYFVGWTGWNQVRQRMKSEEGPQFNLAAFHKRALEQGAIPLPDLGKILVQ